MMMKNHFQKKTYIILGISLILITLSQCTSAPTSTEKSEEDSSIHISYSDNTIEYKKETLKKLDAESIIIDSLFIQIAYEVSSERWIIIGNSVDEDPTGLKLLLVDPTDNYSLIYRSKGAYESFTFLPRFFTSEDKSDPMIILCALGQMDSWGQNLFLMKGDTINEIAYMDVALKPETDGVSEEYTLKNISPFTKIEKQKDGIYFSFDADSMMYYGEVDGNYDPIISAQKLNYKYFKGVLSEEWQE